MRVELAATKTALEERKVIESAKGLVMRGKGIGEHAIHALIRKAVMDQGKRIANVAQALVTTADLMK